MARIAERRSCFDKQRGLFRQFQVLQRKRPGGERVPEAAVKSVGGIDGMPICGAVQCRVERGDRIGGIAEDGEGSDIRAKRLWPASYLAVGQPLSKRHRSPIPVLCIEERCTS